MPLEIEYTSRRKKIIMPSINSNHTRRLASTMMLAMGAYVIDTTDSIKRNWEPAVTPGYQPPMPRRSYANKPVDVPGKNRNEICACGCGKKRKKCKNGNTVIVPPAHTLDKQEYTYQVADILEAQHGISVAAGMLSAYTESHIHSYWSDEMITPQSCAELVTLMAEYDKKAA